MPSDLPFDDPPSAFEDADPGMMHSDSPGTAPHNTEAEQSVLGGLLIAPDRWDLIEGRISGEDFFTPAYGKIFDAIENITRHGQPIDILVLKNELTNCGHLEEVGGHAAITALVNAVPTGAHVEYYAEIVKKMSLLRKLIGTSSNIIQKATSSGEDAMDILDAAEREIMEISSFGVTSEASSLNAVLKETWDKITMFQQSGGEGGVTGLPTYFHRLNEMTTGLHGGELIVVAGRPGMGKSTFALNMLRHMGKDHNIPAVLYTLEMSAENIVRNMLTAESRMNAQRMRSMKLNAEEIAHLRQATDKLYSAPIYIDDTPSISLVELRGKTRRLQSSKGIKIVFVDYLQLMTASATARNRSREQEVAEISKGLKSLAMELDIPVIAMAQLKRKPDGRKDTRPILSDLRESGSIEQDADMVVLLHREDYSPTDQEAEGGKIELIIAKQRNGPTGIVEVAYIKDQMRMENLAPGSEQGYAADAGEY